MAASHLVARQDLEKLANCFIPVFPVLQQFTQDVCLISAVRFKWILQPFSIYLPTLDLPERISYRSGEF